MHSFLFWVILAALSTANAATVTYTFVTSIASEDGDFSLKLAATVSDVPISPPDATAVYPILSASLMIGTETVFWNDNDSQYLQISQSATVDEFSMHFDAPSLGGFSGYPTEKVHFLLHDTTGRMFSSASLPQQVDFVALADTINISVNTGDGPYFGIFEGAAYQTTMPDVSASIPEPGTPPVIFAGLFLFGRRRRSPPDPDR